MLKRLRQRLLLVLVLILGLSVIVWQLWQHPAQQTEVERRQLTDGSSASLATPRRHGQSPCTAAARPPSTLAG